VYKRQGLDDSGTYAFIWDNPSKGAVLSVETWSGSNGGIRFILEDARGKEVLNKKINLGESDAFSVDGRKGKWKVGIVFSEYSGEGSFNLNPVN
jgi:hypothetical protein